MIGRGYLTPDSVPEDSQCRVLRIPNSTAWLSVFMGALLPLAQSESWQKSGTLTTQEAADAALDVIWNAYTNANQECPLDVRQNEETPCILEKSFDGGETWEEFANLQLCPPLVVIGADGTPYVSDDGGETYHPAPVEALPRTPVEGQDTVCLAAANAVAVFVAAYAQVQDYFGSEVLFLVAVAGIIALILALLGLPIAFGAAVTAFTELWNILSSLTADDFDSDVQHEFQCIIDCNSTLDEETGIVSVDYTAVLDEVGLRWTPPVGFNIWTAIQYLLTIVGEDGLNRAASTTSIAEAECTDCGCGDSCNGFDDPGTFEVWQRVETVPAPTWDEGFGNPEPSILSGYGTEGSNPSIAAGATVDLGAEVTVFHVSYALYNASSQTGVYLVVNLLDADHELIATNNTPSDGSDYEQDVWSTVFFDVEGSGVRFVQVGTGANTPGLSGSHSIDNVCWS